MGVNKVVEYQLGMSVNQADRLCPTSQQPLHPRSAQALFNNWLMMRCLRLGVSKYETYKLLLRSVMTSSTNDMGA